MARANRARGWLPEIVLLTATATLYLAGLGADAMRDWDEATYAAVAREMRATGDWLTPRLDGRPFNNKPPLVLWLLAASQAALGDDELAARLPVALLGLAGVAAAYFLGRRLGGRSAGFLAAAILGTAPQWLRFSRQAMLDVPLATALSLAFLAALAGSWPWLGVALGASLLIKGPAALVALPPLALWAAAGRPSRAVAVRGSALGLAIAAPWHVHQVATQGAAFASSYFGVHIAARLGTAVEGNSGPWWYYLEYVLFHWVNPWHWIGAAAVAAFTASALRNPRRPERVLVAAWFWTVLLGFSLAGTKLHWYAMPLYPALAAMTAAWLAPLAGPATWMRRATVALCVATAALAAGEVALGRLRNRAAESTRTVLHALPPAAETPELLVAEGLPLDTARFYARRPVGRWAPGSPLPHGAWALARPVDATGAGLLVVAADARRALVTAH